MARLGLFNLASTLTDSILRHRHERTAATDVRRVEVSLCDVPSDDGRRAADDASLCARAH